MDREANKEDANLTAEPSASLTKEAQALLSPLQMLLKERFGAECRSAQNIAILLSGLALAIAAGLLATERVTESGIEFRASASALVLLLYLSSLFFLTRFLFLAWRDGAATRLQIIVASMELNDIIQGLYKTSVTLQTRAEDLASEEFRTKSGELERSVSQHEARVKFVDRLQQSFIQRANFIDRYVTYFEISLPCALALALTCVIVYKGADPNFARSLTTSVSKSDQAATPNGK